MFERRHRHRRTIVIKTLVLPLAALLAIASTLTASSRACIPTPSPQALRFLLARHGQTTFNADKRFQGSLDTESVLTDKGIAQATRLGEWLAESGELPIDGVFVSPLYRAKQTLEAVESVVKNLPAVQSLAELREIDLYEWEGKTQHEIRESNPQAMKQWKERPWELRLGGGRPVVQDLWDRAGLAWTNMRDMAPARAKKILVVSHGTLGKALLSTALGIGVEAFRHFSIANGEVVEVAFPLASDAQETLWRRRYPNVAPWRSSDVERTALADLQSDIRVEIS